MRLFLFSVSKIGIDSVGYHDELVLVAVLFQLICDKFAGAMHIFAIFVYVMAEPAVDSLVYELQMPHMDGGRDVFRLHVKSGCKRLSLLAGNFDYVVGQSERN